MQEAIKKQFLFSCNAGLWWIFIQPAGLLAGRQCRVYVHEVRPLLRSERLQWVK